MVILQARALQLPDGLLMEGLDVMRIGITPCGSKMAISTQAGMLFVIHDLDLATFEEDMREVDFDDLDSVTFTHSLTTGSAPFDAFAMVDLLEDEEGEKVLSAMQVLTRRRNRVEILPQEHLRPGTTMSILFDPTSQFMLTRRYTEDGEETFIYDVGDRPQDKGGEMHKFNDEYAKWIQAKWALRGLLDLPGDNRDDSESEEVAGDEDGETLTDDSDDEDEATSTEDEGSDTEDTPQPPGPPPPDFSGFAEYPHEQSHLASHQLFEMLRHTPHKYLRFTDMIFRRQVVHLQESNFSTGFFKSSCFSNCGRFVCSPYHRGVRVFDVEAKDRGVPIAATLHKAHINTHKDNVLVTAFSPTLPVMASGGIDGSVCFYSPWGALLQTQEKK